MLAQLIFHLVSTEVLGGVDLIVPFVPWIQIYSELVGLPVGLRCGGCAPEVTFIKGIMLFS